MNIYIKIGLIVVLIALIVLGVLFAKNKYERSKLNGYTKAELKKSLYADFLQAYESGMRGWIKEYDTNYAKDVADGKDPEQVMNSLLNWYKQNANPRPISVEWGKGWFVTAVQEKGLNPNDPMVSSLFPQI